MGVYKNPYAIGELNFSMSLAHTGQDERIVVLKTGDNEIEVSIRGGYFRKTDGSGNPVNMQLDVEELAIVTDGGTIPTTLLLANLNRNNPDTLGLIVLDTPTTLDRTGAINIFRTGDVAEKASVSYSPILDFNYILKRNTEYIFISTILLGDSNTTSEGILYGTIRKNEEG